MWTRFWLLWKVLGLYDDLRTQVKEGKMGAKDFINLGVSALLAGVATFWAVHLACPDPTGCWGAAMTGGGSAAIAAQIQHLRGNPLTPPAPTA